MLFLLPLKLHISICSMFEKGKEEEEEENEKKEQSNREEIYY